MKKNYLLLGAMALAGLFASCSQTETEDLVDNRTEIGKRVTFTATVPTEFAQPKTRATGDVRRYIVEVWNSDATKILQRKETIATETDADKFSFDLDEGTYQILFWADNVDASSTSTTEETITFNGDAITFDHYADKYFTTIIETDKYTIKTTGLRRVTMWDTKNFTHINREECGDAFCHHEELVKTADMVDMKVTLKRPLCKIILQQKNATQATTTDLCKQLRIDKTHIIQFVYWYDIYSGDNGIGAIGGGTNFDIPSSAATDGNLLYFYSFAPKTPGTLNAEEKFALISADGVEIDLEDLIIPKNTIPLKQNYQIYVKGNIIKEKTTGTTTAFTIFTDAEWTGKDETTDLNSSN